MKTVIIGSGNVAYHLSKAFTQSGNPPIQVFGRNEEALREISSGNEIPYSTDILADADFYLICVKDSAVAEVSSLIKKENGLVAHTSGSLPKEVLLGNYRKACFYPLQTFSKNKALNYSEIPFFIEAENTFELDFLKTLAEKISPLVTEADFNKRKFVHLTAVFTCNFVNHLFARGKEISDAQGIPFDWFYPLIDETVEKIRTIDPRDAQTGPAIRNDERILAAHEALITDPGQLEIYKVMNESIKKMYHLK